MSIAPNPSRSAGLFFANAEEEHKRECREVLYFLLLYKCLSILLLLGAVYLAPPAFNLESYSANFHWPPAKHATVSERFTTWDGEHYLYLSRHGYSPGETSSAFYPLWPLLLGVVAQVAPSHNVIAGFMLANILSLFAWAAFYLYVVEEYGTRVAALSTGLLLAYPGSMYFMLLYSESLFFLLLMGTLLLVRRGRYLWATALALLLPMIRALGALVAFALAVDLWQRRRCRGCWFVVGGPIVGWGGYLLFMLLATGNAWEGLQQQQSFIARGSIVNLFDIVGFLGHFLSPMRLHGFLDSAIDRAFFLCFMLAMPRTARLGSPFVAMSIVLGVAPAMINSFGSYTRYMTMAFPVFIAGGHILAEPRHRVLVPIVLAGLFGLQLILLWRQVNFYWVG